MFTTLLATMVMSQTSVLIGAGAARDELQSNDGWANQVHLAYAWATARQHDAPLAVILLAKVHRAVIGLYFDQTDPNALRALVARVPAQVWADFNRVLGGVDSKLSPSASTT